MTESQFIEQNKKQWRELEILLERQVRDADKLHSLFVKVSSDLSYARTFYPNRSVRLYLNNLTQRVLDSMRTTEEKFSFGKIKYFFQHILPFEIYRSRKAFLVSLSVFVIALLIGVISSIHNPEFPAIILGQEYIDITNENINNGDPMAIYKDEDKTSMFFGITTNNIKVSFLAFVLGLIGSIGTIIVLLSNGIMVGAFQYFFYSKGLFLTSFLTIWIHGTIEISAIIIAGAAGIILGNGLLFPKTYNRSTSLQVSAMRALRILLGTVPLFIIAGLLESFVTRLTELPTFVKAGIIFFSFLLILIMFVIYPWYYNKMGDGEIDSIDIKPNHAEDIEINKISFKQLNEIVSSSLFQFRKYFGLNMSTIFFPTICILIISFWFYLNASFETDDSSLFNIGSLFRFQDSKLPLIILIWILISFGFSMMSMIATQNSTRFIDILKFLKQHFIKIAIASLLIYLPYALIPSNYFWLAYLLIPPHFAISIIEKTVSPSQWKEKSIVDLYAKSFKEWPSFILPYLIIIFAFYMGVAFIYSPISDLFIDFVKWHDIFDSFHAESIFVDHLMYWFLFCILSPLFYYFMTNQLYSNNCKESATDLKLKFEKFGKESTVFEKL